MPDYSRGCVSCCKPTWDRVNGLQHADDCPFGQAVKAMHNDEPTVILVHALHEGRTLCGYGDNYSAPGEWPKGHVWAPVREFSWEHTESVNEERKRLLKAHNPGQMVLCFTPYVNCEKCEALLPKSTGSDVRMGMDSKTRIQEKHAALVRQFIRDLWDVEGSPQDKRESLKEVIASLKRSLHATVGIGGT